MKKPLTKNELKLQDTRGNIYIIPKSIAKQYILEGDETSISSDVFFAPLERKYTKAGLLLRGLRIREGLTQEKFSKKIDVTQANLSKMELGHRAIGRTIAQRIEKVFGVNYKIFLE
jgi:DNA-binding XRE family transcriptional regulator